MVRLQQNANQVITYCGSGRSFYLCHDCINNTKKTKKLARRLRQNEEQLVKLLKELTKNG